MRYRFSWFVIMAVVLFSCKKDSTITDYPSPYPPPPVQAALLKDIILDHLPSPYYHFEYNAAGKVSFVSFASDFFRYDVTYDGDRISRMTNNILVNKDRIQYFYDDQGRVNAVTYADSMGRVYTKISLAYDGAKLIKFEREKKVGADFIVDKTITMSYHPDGNLLELKVYRPAALGQSESTIIDHYEEYDKKFNVEGIGLLKDEFFDHFVFLPGVQLQKNNPGKLLSTVNGTDYYKVDFTYTFNDLGLPVARSGAFEYLSGTFVGQKLQLSSTYTYYP